MESNFVVLRDGIQIAKFKYRPDAWDYLDFKKKSHPKQIWQWHAEKYIKENWEDYNEM